MEFYRVSAEVWGFFWDNAKPGILTDRKEK